ncbi:DNA-binding response regulator, partial [Streptomyces sp. NPDC049627]
PCTGPGSAVRVAAGGEVLLSPAATKGLIARFLAQGGSEDDDRAQLVVIAYESGLVRPRVE